MFRAQHSLRRVIAALCSAAYLLALPMLPLQGMLALASGSHDIVTMEHDGHSDVILRHHDDRQAAACAHHEVEEEKSPGHHHEDHVLHFTAKDAAEMASSVELRVPEAAMLQSLPPGFLRVHHSGCFVTERAARECPASCGCLPCLRTTVLII